MVFDEDLEIAFDFFGAVYAGVKTLGGKDISGVDKAAWEKAAQYLLERRKAT
jgi:predicted phosphoadenosine phosphosulfate sulfurtransferase